MTRRHLPHLTVVLLLVAACGAGEEPASPPDGANRTDAGPAIGSGPSDQPFGGRGGHRNLRAVGGASRTTSAVDLGLEWLKKAQNEDGSWDAGDRRVRSTSLALLAFLGSGETHKHGRFMGVVREGFRWLKQDVQSDDGAFALRDRDGWLLDYAIATLAMTEIFTKTRSPLFKECAQAALDLLGKEDLAALEDPARTWVACAFAATRSSREWPGLATLGMPDGAFERILASYGSAGPTRAPAPLPPATPQARRAAEILVRILAGEDPRKSEAIESLVPEVLETLPATSDDDPGATLFGTLALFQVGGDAWKTWNGTMKDATVGSQVRGGENEGSWDPKGEPGAALGRVGTTAIHVMCMEVYYAYSHLFTLR